MAFAVPENFRDLLNPQFAKIFNDRYKQLPDRVSDFYSIVDGASAPMKDRYKMSELGTFGDVPEFLGSVTYDEVTEQWEQEITYREYADGFQVTRRMHDDDLTGYMAGKPKGLATALNRTRQKHAASTFNNATSLDSTWLFNEEGVPLVSDSHTTRSPGVSTASGFDNQITTALSSVSLAAARIQMVNFRDDRGNRIAVMPDMLLIPPDLYQTAFEIVESAGRPELETNARNVHQGRYKIMEWNYLTDVNNCFLIDSTMMKDMLIWVDRVKAEFKSEEVFDTFVAKWRLYARYGLGYNNWRWVLGFNVSG